MPTLSIPPAIDEILSAASRHHGVSPPMMAALASISRSVMRAYAGADVDVSQLVRALKKIGQRLAPGVDEVVPEADAAACEDLAALARELGRVVDGSIAPGGTAVAAAPIAIESLEPSGPASPASEAAREPHPFTGDIVAEHLDEAGFCRTCWDAALHAPNYTAAEVQEGPEERLRAHLDALVLGGRPVAERVLVPALDHEDAPTAFAAAWSLLASEEGDFDDAVVGAFAAAEGPRGRELARALALAPSHAPSDRLVQALPGLPPAARAEAARTLTRWFEGSGDIRRWLASDDPALIAGTLRGLSGDLTSWAELLERHLRATDPAVVSAAIRPGLCVGLVDAWDACVVSATGGDPGADDLIALSTLGGAAEHAAVERALQSPGSRRSALFALGFSGRRRAAELCLEIIDMEDRDLAAARVAGEAFSAITGLVIEGAYARREPDDDDAGDDLGARDADSPRASVAEAALPLTDGPAIRAWWASAASRFQPGQRYLGGAPISAAGLVAALTGGPMRRRPGLALELAVRSRGAFTVDTTDWISRQRAALAALPIPRIGDFTALFGAGD
jgi:uncharacterized protein (TIGR02270 family)